MYVTEHALERLAERTKVLPVDFISQMNYGKLVWIGQSFYEGKKFHFFLFYSDPDKDFFISVVNEKKNRVLSIWKTNFALPRGVAIGSRKKKRRILARKNYREWFRRHQLKPIEVPVEILIEVVHGSKNKIEFSQTQERMLTCPPGELPKFSLDLVREDLIKIFRAVDLHRDQFPGKMQYHIWMRERKEDSAASVFRRCCRYNHKHLLDVFGADE